MTTTRKYNKSEIMTAAWSEFKSTYNVDSMSGEVVFTFAECLKNAWNLAKMDSLSVMISKETVKSVFNYLDLDYAEQFDAEAKEILTTVSNESHGFQADIAERALETGRISTKQAWCVAYEFKAVA